MSALGKTVLVALGILLVSVSVAFAVDGDLDTSFGGDGLVTTQVSAGDDAVHALLALPDGKLVAAGSGNASFSLARYNDDGSLDSSFDGDGKAAFSVGPDGEATAIARQSDGKLVVAGSTWTGSAESFVVARFNANGSVDSGFGVGGKRTIAFGTTGDFAQGVAVAPDGKIVVAGISLLGTPSVQTGARMAAARLTTDGDLDDSFDGDGKALASVGTTFDKARGVVVQTDGKVVVAGDSHNADDDHDDFAFFRWKEDGSPDGTFGSSGGKVFKLTALHDDAHAIALQPDGKILAGGFSDSEAKLALVRLNTNGTPDTSFSGDGIVTSPVSGYAKAGVNALALQSDGKILAGGFAGNGSNYRFALARYTSGGALDSSFSGGGAITTSVGANGTTPSGKAFCDGVAPSCPGAHGLALMPSGAVALGGSVVVAGSTDWQLARFKGTAPAGPTGPTGGPTGPTGEPTGPTGNPTGPTGEPTGPTGGPTGPTGEPTGPTGEPTGPTGEEPTPSTGEDPGPTTGAQSAPPIFGKPRVTAVRLQRANRMSVLVNCAGHQCSVRGSVKVKLPGGKTVRSRTGKLPLGEGLRRLRIYFSKSTGRRVKKVLKKHHRLSARFSINITSLATGFDGTVIKARLRR